MAERRKKSSADKEAMSAARAPEAKANKKADARDVSAGQSARNATAANPPISRLVWILLGVMLLGFTYAMIELLPPSLEFFREAFALWKAGQLK